MYDRACSACGIRRIDQLEPIATPDPVCLCGARLERVFLPTGRGQVLGDECDVWAKHAICNDDGSPKHYTSKAEMRRAAAAKGMEPHVVHIGTKGGDKSKHTTRWT